MTIFGQSGGAGKVSTLLGMPAAQGLFHRAAAQSGVQVTSMPAAVATPLPPRKRTNTENTCPATAAIPQASPTPGSRTPPPTEEARRVAGTNPLAMSNSPTGTATFHPAAR